MSQGPGTATPNTQQIRTHLLYVLSSPTFASSKRCREFLQYVVGLSIAGRADEIKERVIATEVFGRGGDYEPGEDSVVRVRASEVRKRLAHFYESEGKGSPLRIDLPLGSYVPRFELVPLDQPAPPLTRPSSHRRWIASAAVVFLLALGGLFAGWYSRRQPLETDFQRLWRPVLNHAEPLLVFVPILKVSTASPEFSDRVGSGAAQAAIRVTNLFTTLGHGYTVKMGGELTFADLRRQPAILLGAYSQYWTAEMNQGLRYRFDGVAPQMTLLDSQTGRRWEARGYKPTGYAEEDVALASRILDSKTGQVLFLASGITTFGTQCAAEFLTDPHTFSQLLHSAPAGWERKSFQVVLSTRIIGSTPGPPKVIADHFW